MGFNGRILSPRIPGEALRHEDQAGAFLEK